ncbi:c2 domain-containing protein [Trichoderma breve]|uniref:C2 domain-containing protein n=1 Tax=Trichoderma breve TaxID=2034170 RepID=A0A9W9E7W2_9HYPO|nr:c2 domain-containing protein [Trichoderma breve]KAJ4860825.1 c2 domain-containing protein [Trichoderma breve]
MSAQEARELKLQGAIEAAQDPGIAVSADDAERLMVDQARNAGAPAFHFDPNATIEEKRSQVAAAIPPELQHLRRNKATAIATDVDDGTGPDEELPEPTKEGVVEVSKDEQSKTLANGDDAEVPYSRTGWAPQIGWPVESALEAESLLDHTTWVESQLPDHLFGDWYHNTGVIIFACIASWLVAVFGGGLGWVIMVMAICGTYYRTSLRRVRRNFRDDITREMALKRLEADHESLEWINSFMVKFWPIYQPVLAQTIVNTVDQVLSSATPAFLDSLKLKTFTLGTKPPRMEHVKTYPNVGDDIVRMDWKFSFTPNDTTDMTKKQIKNKINPKVVLEIRVGKAMISKGLDVIVEDMAFSGIMRLNIKLQIPFPHVEKIEMCFLEKPTIDYVCKPLGGESFGFDINFIPGLEKFILEQIHGNLAPMMYAPHVFPIEVAKMLAGSPVDQAIGVLVVTLHGAHNLKNTDNFAGTVDPYAVLTLNRRQELARTKTIDDNPNPRWNETHYIIVTSFNDTLDIQVFDKNGFRKSKELGVASFPLERIEELHVYENERLEVLAAGKNRGVVSCDLRFFPVLEGLKGEDGKVEPPPVSNQGILRFTVEQAKDLDGTKSLVGLLNPYAVMFLNDRKRAKLGVTIKDDRDLASDLTLGKYQIKLDDLLECMEQGKEWYHLSGAQTGRVKMMAQWKPVAISGVAGTGGYITPIGVMRLHFQKANDLRNFEAFGKSDPYVRVLLSGIDKARTVTFKNDLNPVWDEVLYVPVHSARDRLTLEVMDEEKVGKDRSLGLCEVSAADYIQQDELGEYLVHDTKRVLQSELRIHGKGISKGTLTYTVAFYPCLNIADPEEEEEEAAEAAEENGEEPRASLDRPQSSASKSAPKPSLDASRKSVDVSRKSVDTAKLSAATGEDGRPISPASMRSSMSVEKKGPPKIRLSPEELLRYESGVLIFRLLESEMPERDSQLEIYVDDMAYPSYTSTIVPSKSHKFDEIGDCIIRELDFSRLTIKARKKGDDAEDTLAYLSGNTLETLKQCLNNPTTLKLKSDDGKSSWVKVSLKYIPLKMDLDASESINNMGNLRVDVLSGTDLPSADRNGKSDPYCKFELNDVEVYKTKVQKKTLSPVWNEFFEVSVPSRTGAHFVCNVYDYDFADKPDFLGATVIRLDNLQPFKAMEQSFPLDGKSGSIKLRMVFRPDYVTRARQGTSTFQGTFGGTSRIVTGVAGVPFKGATAVGHGVGRGASFLKRGILGKKDRDDPNGSLSELTEVPTVPSIITNGSDFPNSNNNSNPSTRPTTSAVDGSRDIPPHLTPEGSGHNRTRSFGSSSVHSAMGFGAPTGTATFTVVGASGYSHSTDLYILITQISPREKVVGKTKHYKSPNGQWTFDETFRFSCTPDAQFKIEARGEHLFGSDDGLGEHFYFVDETGSAGAKDLSVGAGTVTVKSSFQPAEEKYPDSPKSFSRRGFLSKREARSRDPSQNP